MPSRAPTATRHSSPGSSRRASATPASCSSLLALDDVRRAADILATTYIVTAGSDGFVSFECTPDLADDTEATIAQARDLWARLQRPNTMIKVPATTAGVPAIERLTADGVNVNVTLLFSVDRYQQVIDAYQAGLEARVAAGQSIEISSRSRRSSCPGSIPKSTPSFPPDRPTRASRGRQRRPRLRHLPTIDRERPWQHLAAAGARPQRPLWASTGTKNDAYSDVLYVESLIAPGVVNTMPSATLEAFADHGTVTDSLTYTTRDARTTLDRLRIGDVDLRRITDELEREGIRIFCDSYAQLLSTIDDTAAALSLGSPHEPHRHPVARAGL